MRRLSLAVFVLFAGSLLHGEEKAGWKELFNGKDTTGWKLCAEKVTTNKFVDADGKDIADAKQSTVEQKEEARDAANKPIPGAKIAEKDGKKFVVDGITGKPLADAKIVKTGGRQAVVDKAGKEIKGAKAVPVTKPNESGWTVEKSELVCSKPHGGNDLLTEEKFTDFELHVEFQATSNSGVYLQGRYEIQIDNSLNAKPKVVEKDGKKIETLDSNQCGAVYGKVAPSKNMAKPPMEWQTFDVVFHGAKVADGKVVQKARVTLVWNGEKVIDNAEIDGVTGGALDGKVGEPGPILLQGDHGRVAFRNVRIKPLTAK